MAKQPISFAGAIIIVLVGLYSVVGLLFFVYGTWKDARRRRITGTWLFIVLMSTEAVGFVLCLLAWPLLWLLLPPDEPAPQPPKYVGPEK